MKKSLVAIAIAATVAGITGCSSTGGVNPGANATTAISEQRASSNFTRQGVKINYTFSGDVESIETTGYAPIWGSSENAVREAFRVAELEAKKSLNDFIHKETIKSSVSVRMISMNIEHAEDRKNNRFQSNNADNVVSDTDRDVEGDEASVAGSGGSQDNTAVRRDALKVASKVNTFIVTQNKGIIGGLYLVEGEVINDGKNVRVVYKWDKKAQASRIQLRNLLSQ